MPTGPKRKGSVIRGDVFLVDEDTDLLDPVFQNGGKENPQQKGSRNGLQKGKPDASSKHLDENITTGKKTESSERFSPFPGKPSDDIIDLDTDKTPKRPRVGFPGLPDISSDPRTAEDSTKLKEKTTTVLPTSHVITSGSLPKDVVEKNATQITTHLDHIIEHNNKLPDKKYPEIITIVSRDGDLVQGSDGKIYRLHRGQPGKIGPPGSQVSGLIVFFLFLFFGVTLYSTLCREVDDDLTPALEQYSIYQT